MSRPILADCFESAAEEALRLEPSLETADVTAISIAISLKRIADKLDSVTDYRFDLPSIRTTET